MTTTSDKLGPGGGLTHERKVEDIEVVTPHYRGAYAAAKERTGFSSYRISTGLGGRGGRSGRSPNPRIFEEFL